MMFIKSLAIFASVASATSFQAFSGNSCDGNAGSVVTVGGGGSCEEIPNRHSWKVSGDNVKGFYYSSSGCQGQSTQFSAQDNTCQNINTGGVVGSVCVIGKSQPHCEVLTLKH